MSALTGSLNIAPYARFITGNLNNYTSWFQLVTHATMRICLEKKY